MTMTVQKAPRIASNDAVRIAAEVCSIPLHPHLGDADARIVVEAVRAFGPDR